MTDFAKKCNEWRIVPRLLIMGYGYTFYEVSQWFMTLDDPTVTQAAFVSTIVGAAAAFFGLYVNSGKSTTTQVINFPQPNGRDDVVHISSKHVTTERSSE